jgi:hypothetical protein
MGFAPLTPAVADDLGVLGICRDPAPMVFCAPTLALWLAADALVQTELRGVREPKKAKQRGDRFTVHYTPVHGSWLTQAEIEISVMAGQCLGNRRLGSIDNLRREAGASNRRSNRAKFNWKFDRRAARRKFKYRVCFKRSRT